MTQPIELVINGKDNTGGAFASAGGGLAKIGQIAAGILTSQVFTKLAQGAIEFGKSVFTEAMDAQLGLAQLDAVLTSTAGASGMTRDAVISLADSLSGVTRYSDDAILAGENMLLTFTNIGEDVFPQATETILNMSTSLGQDLQTSAIQLGKALNDPVAGVTALQRVGVKLTEEQKKQVESFMAVNDIASAQKIILGELATEFGGSAEAAGKTFAGQMDILKNKVNNLKEGLGLKLMPTLQSFADKMIAFADNPAVIKFFDDLANGVIKILEGASKLPSMFEGAKTGVMNFITPFIPAIKSIMSTMEAMRPTIEAVAKTLGEKLAAAGKELSEKVFPFLVEKMQLFADWFAEHRPMIEEFAKNIGVAIGWLADAVVGMWDVVEPLLSGLIDIILELAEFVMEIVDGDWAGAWESFTNIIDIAFETVEKTVNAAVEWIANRLGTSMAEIKAQWSSNWNQLKQIVSQVWTIIKTTISNKIAEIKAAIDSKMNEIKTSIITKWNEIKTAITTKLTEIVTSVITKFNEMKTSITNKLSEIITAVKNKWAEIVAAIKAKLTEIITNIITWGLELKNKIGEQIQKAIDFVKDKITGFIDIGKNIINNIIEGLENNFQALVDYLKNLIAEIVGGIFGGESIGGEIAVRNIAAPQMAGAFAGSGFSGGGMSSVTNSRATTNYYNSHITVYTGKVDPKKSMRGFI